MVCGKGETSQLKGMAERDVLLMEARKQREEGPEIRYTAKSGPQVTPFLQPSPIS
jgi:hypothetical protein